MKTKAYAKHGKYGTMYHCNLKLGKTTKVLLKQRDELTKLRDRLASSARQSYGEIDSGSFDSETVEDELMSAECLHHDLGLAAAVQRVLEDVEYTLERGNK